MTTLRRNLQPLAAIAIAAFLLVACGKVTYKLPDEFMTDGELLAASMKEAASHMGENRLLKSENGPFVFKSLAGDDETEYQWLYNRFEDLAAAELSSRDLEVIPEATGNETVIKYRLLESRIVNAKADGGRVKRIGRTIAHIRIYGLDGELFWAGEYEGEFENAVPKKIVSRLEDERIEQIGPRQPEAGQNPFVEPLLVTGITGALIYLFAVSASAK